MNSSDSVSALGRSGEGPAASPPERAVIFLDVDGVLNGFRSLFAFGGYAAEHLDPVAIRLINRLCIEVAKAGFTPEVVISSTWRMNFPDLQWWHDLWASHDAGAIATVGMTDTGPGKRGAQVARWLALNGNPARFVCIDDDSDFLPGQPHVKTPFESGLGLDHIASAFVALTGQPASWAPRIFGTTGVDDGEAVGPSPLTNTPSEPNTSEDHEPLCECDVCSPHLAGGKR